MCICVCGVIAGCPLLTEGCGRLGIHYSLEHFDVGLLPGPGWYDEEGGERGPLGGHVRAGESVSALRRSIEPQGVGLNHTRLLLFSVPAPHCGTTL